MNPRAGMDRGKIAGARAGPRPGGPRFGVPIGISKRRLKKTDEWN